MPKVRDFEPQNAASTGDEGPQTLAAIDEGIRDVKAGRTVLIKEVREMFSEWITASSSCKER